MVLRGMANASSMYLNLTKTDAGYAGAVTIGVTLKTTAAAKPSIAAGGVVNAASYKDGVAPGSWVAIFGDNLASSTRVLSAADAADGKLPATLGGVSVQIGGQPAYMYYVSPTQLVVQAPELAVSGAAQVTVTNAGGTSSAGTVTVQPVAPAFFTTNGYVAAIPVGNVLQLYGTGFGATSPGVAAGAVFLGSAAVSNAVTAKIGGQPAEVLWAGLVGAGLYQVNVAVPQGMSGDREVVATVAGMSTPAGLVRV